MYEGVMEVVAKHPHIKPVISIGGWTWGGTNTCPTFSKVLLLCYCVYAVSCAHEGAVCGFTTPDGCVCRCSSYLCQANRRVLPHL